MKGKGDGKNLDRANDFDGVQFQLDALTLFFYTFGGTIFTLVQATMGQAEELKLTQNLLSVKEATRNSMVIETMKIYIFFPFVCMLSLNALLHNTSDWEPWSP